MKSGLRMTKTHTPGDAESCAVFVFTAGSEAFALVQSCASKFPFCWHQTVFNMGASESSAPPDHASGLQPNPHAYSVLCILEVKRCSTLLLVAAFKVGLLHLHHVSAMCRSLRPQWTESSRWQRRMQWRKPVQLVVRHEDQQQCTCVLAEQEQGSIFGLL